MVYRFTIISDEVDDFIREIQIDSEATFHELHEAILKAAKYSDDQMTSFFICDDDWEKEQEITLEDMGGSSEEDSYIMRETRLSELLEDEKQKMLYVFDPLTERVFFIELSEIIYGKDLANAVCTRKEGIACDGLYCDFTGSCLCRIDAELAIFDFRISSQSESSTRLIVYLDSYILEVCRRFSEIRRYVISCILSVPYDDRRSSFYAHKETPCIHGTCSHVLSVCLVSCSKVEVLEGSA